jgi:hypothetical protein
VAIPLLSTLSVAARTALPFIERGVREGLASRAINAVLKSEFGKGLRRQVLLDVMRAVSGVQSAGAQLKFLGLDKIPNPARIPAALTTIRREFSYKIEVRGVSSMTGQSMTRFVQVTSSRNLTRREMQDAALDAIGSDQERYGITDYEAVPVSAVRAGSSGYFE